MKRGRALGVVDDYSLALDEVIEQADVIVVGAPPAATASVLRDIMGTLAVTTHQPIITDLASIKGYVVDSVPYDYPHFVPGHPIAGSEHSGVEHSDAGLFTGREVILTPLPHTAAAAVAQVEAMWALTGAYIRAMDVQQHDALLAASSHMPHVVAYALTRALERDASDPMIHGGGALRDMTRIAGSDPRMWTDIAVTNRQALLAAIDQFEAEMTMLRELVDLKDAQALEEYFSICRAHRRDHDGILNPISETAAKENHEV